MFRFEDGIYYFQCLPPDVGSLDLSADTPMTKHAHEDPIRKSVYFQWWRYLCASSEYTQTCIKARRGEVRSEVFDHFGKVRSDDDFVAWWRDRGRYLFCEPQELGIRTLDADNWPDAPNDTLFENRLVVSLPVNADADRTISEVRALLNSRKPKDALRKRNKSEALFQPYTTKPDVNALDRLFKVWQCRLQNQSRRLYEVAIELGAKEPRIEAEIEDWRIKQTQAVSRDLNTVECILQHVAQGVFPVMGKSKAKGVEQHLAQQRLRLGVSPADA